MTTITIPVHAARSGKTGAATLTVGPRLPKPPVGRVPRLSRLMALAIRCDGLLASGAVESRAELARRGRVTRARMTQVLRLIDLAPDIQEAILFLPPTTVGRDRLTLRHVLPVARHLEWAARRAAWRSLTDRVIGGVEHSV